MALSCDGPVLLLVLLVVEIIGTVIAYLRLRRSR